MEPADLVEDNEGIVHEKFDRSYTVCATYIRHGWIYDALPGAFVTCLNCISPYLETACGHSGAILRNCPEAAALHDDNEQRCNCCDACEERCSENV